MRIAILGSGPAGLFAAHAVAGAGRDLRIFSLGKKSHLNGAQYLHEPIPGLTPPTGHRTISYKLLGTVEEYRQKVYGDRFPGVSVSPETLVGERPGWDIRATYDAAWELYSPEITAGYIQGSQFKQLVHEYELVISTIPADILCLGYRHVFPARPVWAIGDAPGLGISCPAEIDVNEETVVCNGGTTSPWYRAASVFGHRTVEWPFLMEATPPPKATLIRKPVYTDCDCWGDKVLRLGRFGTWNKTELSHMAYYRTKEFLSVHV